MLAAVVLLPFPTAVIASAVEEGNAADGRTAVGLYALIGALLCATWLLFFHYLARHPQLLTDDVPTDFYARERTRALAGVVLYTLAGAAGVLLTPAVALVIFLLLPVFYGVTSHGLTALPGRLQWLLPQHRREFPGLAARATRRNGYGLRDGPAAAGPARVPAPQRHQR
jgi:hypothetical protein